MNKHGDFDDFLLFSTLYNMNKRRLQKEQQNLSYGYNSHMRDEIDEIDMCDMEEDELDDYDTEDDDFDEYDLEDDTECEPEDE